MDQKDEGQGLFVALDNVPASALSRRYLVLRRGAVVYDVDVFYNNDNNNESDFRFDDFVFTRFNTLQYLVGSADMGNFTCGNRSHVLAGM